MAVRHRVAGAALAVLLLAGLTACSGAAPGAGPTASASTGPTALASPTDRSPRGVLLSAQLAMHDARRAGFKYRLGSDTGKGLVFWAPKTVLQLKRSGTDEQLIVLDTSAYLGGDRASADRLGGRHWEKYSGGLDSDGQKGIPYAGLVDRLNPVVALTAAVAAPSPEFIGEEQLQETSAVHYRVSTTVSAYAAAQTQLTAARRQALQTALGTGDITLDLWLNDKDQLVQLTRTGQVDDTVTYSDFAGTLSVQAPAEADTVDAGNQSLPPAPWPG